MFKIEITKNYTKINGTMEERLAGLACLVDTLKENGIPEILIRKSVDIGLEEDKETEKTNSIEVKKINLNNMSRKQAKELLEEEILNKMFN